MKLVPVDFLNAINVVENSTPCSGALKRGDNQYCILGAIGVAWAKRNKKNVSKVLYGDGDHIDAAVRKAVGVRGFGKSHSDKLYDLNDSYINRLGTEKAREWQINKLQNLYWRSLNKKWSSLAK